MKTTPLIFLLLLVFSSFVNKNNSMLVEQPKIAQDTTSAKVWKQRAEAAVLEALMQKKLAEKIAADREELKRKLKECEAKNKN